MEVPLLICRGLDFSYGDEPAVSGLDLEVSPGRSYGLLGPNGAGKTTAIKMIVGLLRPARGEVLLAGKPLASARQVKALIGYVPQSIALFGDLDAVENLRFWGSLYGLRGDQLRQRIDEVLEVVDLRDRSRDRVREYSGGMQRRLNLAVGILHRPRLLVLDEPTVGVDAQSRAAILDNIGELQRHGMAVLYTTHYMEEAQRICDVIGILDQGRLVAEGTLGELLGQTGGREQVLLHAKGNLGAFAREAIQLPDVTAVAAMNGGVRLEVDSAARHLASIAMTAERCDVRISNIDIGGADLEALFLRLTGRRLRD